ncbi:MAG: hypothetical protein ACFFBE_09645 [Promethearchaeota archaeon]
MGVVNNIITNCFICIMHLSLVSIYFFNGFGRDMVKKYYCPRCKTKKIIEYENSIECPDCLLEFDKNNIGVIPDKDILAFTEMNSFIENIDELNEPEKAKKLFNSLMKDLNDEN